MTSPNELLAVCVEAATAGGAELMKWRGRVRPHEKGPCDFVTQADFASQRVIQSIIAGRYPGHAFVGEESQGSAAAALGGWQWFADPLDGTTNFVHGVPYFAVSVAVACDGRVIAGAVLDPTRNECFTAAEGEGAQLDGQVIRTSGAAKLEDALVAFSLPARMRSDDPELADMARIGALSRGLRRFGAAALNLCYVAAGRLDAYWARKLHAWDLAAGSLIVAEAGGSIRSLGARSVELMNPGIIAAATEPLCDELRRELS